MKMDGHSGVSAAVRCALFLEVQLDIEILGIGRGAGCRYATPTGHHSFPKAKGVA